ncbi:uncharacterized protein B0H64DRAFT_53992 [Chaetomium fimeti]|uniref:Secreted protein n=1 Tax=Chaetomium fimeti TaxID=1854472 RepID=A0AAE0LMC0_9PEZI|nr:hypothetical protein B0H64DRAFT_53992 [Chaetomium fimeti]
MGYFNILFSFFVFLFSSSFSPCLCIRGVVVGERWTGGRRRMGNDNALDAVHGWCNGLVEGRRMDALAWPAREGGDAEETKEGVLTTPLGCHVVVGLGRLVRGVGVGGWRG